VPGYHRHTYYSDMVNRETCLYRFYDSAGRLLYVGITMDLSRRLAKHRQRDWWPDVAEADYEYFPGREAAKSAERVAIATEDPIHNITRPKVVL